MERQLSSSSASSVASNHDINYQENPYASDVCLVQSHTKSHQEEGIACGYQSSLDHQSLHGATVNQGIVELDLSEKIPSSKPSWISTKFKAVSSNAKRLRPPPKPNHRDFESLQPSNTVSHQAAWITSMLGIRNKITDRLKPSPKLDFDPYQEQFPPKSFPLPKKTWYNIPTQDDGSHSWPFSETWPPKYFIDIRKHFPIFAAIFITILLPIILVQYSLYPRTQNVGNLPGYDCMHSGKFDFQGIDVIFGHMTFAQAKAIDLAWNTLIGRGMQVFLAFISCRVFYSTLLYICERHPVTYELYTAVALSPTTTKAIRPMLKAVIVNSNFKNRIMMIWLLGLTVYLALLPMLIDAVSGYRAIQLTMLDLSNGTSLDVYNGLISTDYHNIERTQPPPYLGIDEFGNLQDNIAAAFTLEVNITTVFFSGPYSVQNISGNYSSSCINSTTSALILAATYSYFEPTQQSTYEDPSCANWYPLAPVISSRDVHSLWNYTYLKDPGNYRCVSQDIYTWGFSYELQLLVSCLSGICILGTWILYVYTSAHSELLQKGRVFGPWRALMDISEVLRRNLGDGEVCAHSEDYLKADIKRRKLLRYETFVNEEGRESFGLRGWRGKRDEEERLRLDWEREYR